MYLFLERREGEREGEEHQCVGTSRASPLGSWPTAQARAPTSNRTEPTAFQSVGQRSIH